MILDMIMFGNSIASILKAIGVIILGVVIAKILYWQSQNVIKVFASKTKTKLDDILIDILEEPLVFVIVSGSIYYSTFILKLSEGALKGLNKAFNISLVLAVTWFIAKIIDSLISNYWIPYAEKTENDLDDQMIPIVRKIVAVVVWSFGILMVIANLGYNISSIIAGLGIGGIAIAMAVKDILGNMFSGVAVITDKPFKIGDRIRIDGRDGNVTEIGLRSTKIRTLDGTMLVVPNSKVSESIVENVSAENARKVKLNIGLTYDTKNKDMLKAMKIIKQVIVDNKDTKKESSVFFTEFGDFSLNLLTIYYVKNINNAFKAQSEINLKIKEEFEKAKIDMAFPTQTIYTKQVK